ncbi:hypothetical protein [Pseudofrankia inefficax]|uniref:L-lactate permease n=1 Tax=Pseudofrankia inefficax (strain DSM 45817 / CECT 9037 / DDB 130130 / EuI1c) TaxID=298654 RepID=E3IX38_PSEI1|nr:hypothetical protein [Pseudofrankia inefficax]ADP83810.1 hypothetical protein FraEuI1c_5826 [Pseudofrankia inefficax]
MHTLAFDPVTANALGLPSPGAVSAAIPLFFITVLAALKVLPRVAGVLAVVAGAALNHGWLYQSINAVTGWLTDLLNLVTGHLAGGAVPYALPVLLAIYYFWHIRLDSETTSKLLGVRERMLAGVRSGPAGYARGAGGYLRGGSGLDLLGRGRSRYPARMVGVIAVGLMLPSQVHAIPGVAGASLTTVLNVLGGVMAWTLQTLFSVR